MVCRNVHVKNCQRGASVAHSLANHNPRAHQPRPTRSHSRTSAAIGNLFFGPRGDDVANKNVYQVLGRRKKKTWSISDLSCLFARHFVESQTHSLRQFFSLFLNFFSLFLFVSLFVVSVVLLPKMSGPRSYSFDWRSVLENCNRSNALMYPLAYRGNIIAPLMCARLAFKKSSLFGDAGLVCLEACSVFVLPGQRRGFKSYARGFERHREPSQNSRIDCTRSTSPEGARPTSAGDAAAARSYNPSRSRVINSRRYFTFHPPNPMAYALFRTPTYPTQFSLFQFEFRSNQNFALSPLTFSCLPPLKISLGDERP